MIHFNYETPFTLEKEQHLSDWILNVIKSEGFTAEEINFIFCDDDYLHKLNVEFLEHDTLTDVISFDYKVGKILQGDIFISLDRVKDNANDFKVVFLVELFRVMVHGVLHFCGYKDKEVTDIKVMRSKEDFYLLQLAEIE